MALVWYSQRVPSTAIAEGRVSVGSTSFKPRIKTQAVIEKYRDLNNYNTVVSCSAEMKGPVGGYY